MNIGIIIHSKTGHTHSAAEKLQEKLLKAGHSVSIEKLSPVGDAYPGIKNLQLQNHPKIDEFEGLVFAAPVWAFTVSPVMAAYLEQLISLRGKKAACFVMMGFPFAWMGGNQAIAKIKKMVGAKWGTILETAIIGRSGNDEKAVEKMVETLSKAFI